MAAAITGAAANALFAQNYLLSPGDSIVATAQFDDLAVYNILENNISSDSLFLSWKKVSAYVPVGWEAVNCDNNNCYTELKDSGDMLPVVVGEYGLMSVHVTPHQNEGTAIIQYVIWETFNQPIADTLTWIISAGTTGIEDEPVDAANFIIVGNQLFVQNNVGADALLRVFDIRGRILVQTNITSVISAIDMSHIPAGVFLIDLQNAGTHLVKKIFFR